MSTALILFGATFCVVFALGLQSLNVNGGHRWAAFVTSFSIGLSNLVLFKLLPGPTDYVQIAAYLLGGPLGIVASMQAHPYLIAAFRRRSTPLDPARLAAGAGSCSIGTPTGRIMMQMVYVAADPDQPGAAWAVMVDKPEWAAVTARTISEWVLEGAHVMRVEHEVAVDMVCRWVKPSLMGTPE